MYNPYNPQMPSSRVADWIFSIGYIVSYWYSTHTHKGPQYIACQVTGLIQCRSEHLHSKYRGVINKALEGVPGKVTGHPGFNVCTVALGLTEDSLSPGNPFTPLYSLLFCIFILRLSKRSFPQSLHLCMPANSIVKPNMCLALGDSGSLEASR